MVAPLCSVSLFDWRNCDFCEQAFGSLSLTGVIVVFFQSTLYANIAFKFGPCRLTFTHHLSFSTVIFSRRASAATRFRANEIVG